MAVMPLESKLKKILELNELAKSMGCTATALVMGKYLEVDERVKFKCTFNTCGQYRQSWCCPPHTGGIAENREMLKKYDFAIAAQITKKVPDGNYEEVFKSEKMNFTDMIVELEKAAFKSGFSLAAGLSAGHCILCSACTAREGKNSCANPLRARPSMEAMGMNVEKICAMLGLSAGFIPGQVTLTGMLLID